MWERDKAKAGVGEMKSSNGRIIEENSIKCPVCHQLIRAYGINQTETKYEIHLWKSHGVLSREGK